MPNPIRPLLALLLFLPACDEKKEDAPASAPAAGPNYTPKMTAELVPPAAKGLVLGVSTEKDVTAAFGSTEIVKDKSLGGDAVVQYSDQPGVMVQLEPKGDLVKGEAWLMGEGEPKLAHVELVLKTTDTCKWVEDTIGKDPASKGKPGGLMGRVYGPGEYTAGSADGTIAVGLECRASKRDEIDVEVLSYSLMPGGGRSMMMNRNP